MYDLIIIGAGPAGLTASIYASCFHLKHLVIGREIGGQLLLAPFILNYPGFEGISGRELTARMVAQVKKRGGEIIEDSVVKIPGYKFETKDNHEGNGYELETEEGKKYRARAIILATGTERRKLNIPGELEYTARGVHYCAVCEKHDFAGKVCGIVGGANSAVQSAVYLAQAAKKVYIIYRGTQLRGDDVWLRQIKKRKQIEVIYNTVVSEILGDGEKMTGVKLSGKRKAESGKSQFKTQSGKDTSDGDEATTSAPPRWRDILPLDKLFIEIGGVPGTALVIPLGVKMDHGGYIKVNDKLETSVPGMFAAGDLVSYGLSIEQIATAVGLGARASASAFAYIKHEKSPTLWGEGQIRR